MLDVLRGLLRQFAAPLVVVAVLIVCGRWLGSYWPEIEGFIQGLGTGGRFMFVAVFVVLTPLGFPVSVLGFSAGLLYGPWLGLGLLFPAGVLSGALMYWLAHGLMRKRIRQLVESKPRLAAFDRAAGRQSLRLNFLTRLSPLNYGLACYTLASGRSTLRVYLVGLLAILPSMVAQVWLGSLARHAGRTAGDAGQSGDPRVWFLVVGLVFFGILTWQLGRLARRAMQEDHD